MKEQYPIGKQIEVPATVADGQGDVKTQWVTAQIVNYWNDRIGHEGGVVVALPERTAQGQRMNVPWTLLHEDGTGI